MELERASELVAKLKGADKIDLFCHFEKLLNPFPPKDQNGEWNDASMHWQEMFAGMCGFGVAVAVSVVLD